MNLICTDACQNPKCAYRSILGFYRRLRVLSALARESLQRIAVVAVVRFGILPHQERERDERGGDRQQRGGKKTRIDASTSCRAPEDTYSIVSGVSETPSFWKSSFSSMASSRFGLAWYLLKSESEKKWHSRVDWGTLCLHRRRCCLLEGRAGHAFLR